VDSFNAYSGNEKPRVIGDNSMNANAAKLLLLGVTLWVTCAHATQLVQQKWVSVSRSLDGRVLVLGADEPASGATVELCSPDWKKVITSATTDDNGHFSLERDAKSKLFYLRVSARNMDTYQLRVRIDKRTGQELNIHLSVAT
jgi:hypothetical protein